MKRQLRPGVISQLQACLHELERLRTKLGYASCRPAKAAKLRRRIRYQLEALRRLLPRVEGLPHPTDPRTWEVRALSRVERAELEQARALVCYLLSGYG